MKEREREKERKSKLTSLKLLKFSISNDVSTCLSRKFIPFTKWILGHINISSSSFLSFVYFFGHFFFCFFFPWTGQPFVLLLFIPCHFFPFKHHHHHHWAIIIMKYLWSVMIVKSVFFSSKMVGNTPLQQLICLLIIHNFHFIQHQVVFQLQRLLTTWLISYTLTFMIINIQMSSKKRTLPWSQMYHLMMMLFKLWCFFHKQMTYLVSWMTFNSFTSHPRGEIQMNSNSKYSQFKVA